MSVYSVLLFASAIEPDLTYFTNTSDGKVGECTVPTEFCSAATCVRDYADLSFIFRGSLSGWLKNLSIRGILGIMQNREYQEPPLSMKFCGGYH